MAEPAVFGVAGLAREMRVKILEHLLVWEKREKLRRENCQSRQGTKGGGEAKGVPFLAFLG